METNLLNKKSKNEYYNSKEWRKTRKEKLDEQPLCVACASLGKKVNAEDLHHAIKYFEQDDDCRELLLLDKENLVPLCKECHKSIHGNKKIIGPWMLQYLYNLKTYICNKYFRQGIIIKWTEDKTYRKLK